MPCRASRPEPTGAIRKSDGVQMIRRLSVVFALLALAGCAAPPRPSGPAPVPLPPASPRGEPGRFANIDAARLRTLLGAPAFTRKDGATEMWRYDTPTCHAFFFLYSDGRTQRVRHVETLPAGSTAAADPACLNALRKTS